jgi:hypothetical protein
VYTSLFKSLLNVKGACVKPLLQVQPDAAVFNALISACARGGHWAGAKTQKETLYIHPPCFGAQVGVFAPHTHRERTKQSCGRPSIPPPLLSVPRWGLFASSLWRQKPSAGMGGRGRWNTRCEHAQGSARDTDGANTGSRSFAFFPDRGGTAAIVEEATQGRGGSSLGGCCSPRGCICDVAHSITATRVVVVGVVRVQGGEVHRRRSLAWRGRTCGPVR